MSKGFFNKKSRYNSPVKFEVTTPVQRAQTLRPESIDHLNLKHEDEIKALQILPVRE